MDSTQSESGSAGEVPRTPSDVLILGAGVIGLSCAYELLRSGRSVTVLDRQRAGFGSSQGNCGTITPSHLPLHAPGTLVQAVKWMLKPDAPFFIKPRFDPELLGWLLAFARRCNTREFHETARVKSRLLLASRERLPALIAEAGLDCEYAENGTLYVYRDAKSYTRAQGEVELLKELGIPVEALGAAAARQREPALNDSVVGAHFHAGDARLRPDAYVRELARAVRAQGGRIEEHTEVQGFHLAGDRIDAVATNRGPYDGREVLFALGAWSPPVGHQLGLRIPIQPGKGYSITYTRPQRAPLIPLVLKERGVCVTSWDSGYRLGSTMEFSGYDESLNRRRLDALKRGAAEYLYEPQGPAVETEWYGWRPMTYDDLPIIGRAAKYRNLSYATGHGMLGVSLSAITALMVLSLLGGKAPPLDPAPYAPTRFGL